MAKAIIDNGGGNAEVRDSEGRTALFAMIELGKSDLALFALENLEISPSIPQTSLGNFSALHLAIANRMLDVTRSILERAPQCARMKDAEGEEPLFLTIATHSGGSGLEYLQLLLKAGAFYNARNHLGQSAVDLARKLVDEGTGDIGVCEFLEEIHGNVSTFMSRCAEAGRLSNLLSPKAGAAGMLAADTVLDMWNVDLVMTEDHRVTLHIAAEHGIEVVVNRLLQLGAVPDCADDKGSTPLHVACMKKHIDCAKTLIGSNAAVDWIDSEHRSPILIAATAGFDSVLLPLCKQHRPSPSLSEYFDASGFSALHRAAQYGHAECVRLIGESCRSLVNRIGPDLNTPLHVACRPPLKPETVSVLIKLRADLDIEDSLGFRPIDVAKNESLFPIVVLLSNAAENADKDEPRNSERPSVEEDADDRPSSAGSASRAASALRDAEKRRDGLAPSPSKLDHFPF